MTVQASYTFKINPGTDPQTTVESAKRAMAVWRRHGASPKLWSHVWGEVGCMTVTVDFESYAEYGKCHEAVATDPDIQAWARANTQSGSSTWIRSGVLREVPN